MSKKDFFVISESDNLYIDLAPCGGYVVLHTRWTGAIILYNFIKKGLDFAPFFCYYKYRKEISKMKEPKVIKVMEHYEAY